MASSPVGEVVGPRVERRRASVPAIGYPDELPVSQRRDDLAAAIGQHQVVIVAGETGSGKTTQLPKICLELGRGVHGMVGHTQPRRLAARTVAERVAEELDTPVGRTIGYRVRFTDRVSDDSLVKLMTDGILLAEIQSDPMLRAYDTLILDEAHERNLNVDFLLGYLKQLLPRRPDLKVIITSATIDPQRFSEHFDGAPVVEVSGRTYPVEIRYRPVGDDPDRDQTQGVLDAVDELRAEGPGDVLVFLSGEREIRDTADALRARDLPETEILALYARLPAAEQHRAFQPHRGRRIVLATNVAETSLTVPGIRYVIDPGTARISRYSQRLKVQRLPVEPISQASARQRAGRSGRLAEGICIRLYSQDDFEARPPFTDPEILRTNLASVILRMTAAELGEIENFPFVDPPDKRQIRDGIALLEELGALDPSHQKLTATGRVLAQLPVDPRLARVIIEADRKGALHEVLVIVAALSIRDPRERPAAARPAADQAHRRFADDTSDLLAYVNLWRYLRERQRVLSGNQFRKLCRTEYLAYLRVREWQDLYGQLRHIATDLGMTVNGSDAGARPVHESMLSGLLSHIGSYDPDRRDYLGARGARFAILPGSALARKPPRFVMAAELVETSRLFGRGCAKIEPEWAEKLAGHLVKRTYSEPRWERERGAVMATERVSLYGVPLVAQRTVNYGRVDPEASRALFIRHALVEGDWNANHEFFHRNRELLADVAELEHRARRRDILVGDDVLFDFYDQRIPSDVVSVRHFDHWWRTARRGRPDLLTFDPAMLVRDGADGVSEHAYPDALTQGELTVPLSYAFEPGTAADGVTARIPLAALNQVGGDGLDWQVPGLRHDLVVALIRSLPKALRRDLVPVPDTARAALARVRRGEPLLDGLERELDVPRSAFALDTVPEHLQVTFEVVDSDEHVVARGNDLDELRARLAPQLREALSTTAGGIERSGLRDWSIGELPRTHEQQRDGYRVTAYPALVDEGDSVAVRVFETEAQQLRALWRGTRRLLLLAVPSPVTRVQRGLSNQAKLTLSSNPHGSVSALLDDCLAAAVDALTEQAGGPAWDAEGFAALREHVRTRLGETAMTVLGEVQRVLAAYQAAASRLSRAVGPEPSLSDVRTQLGELVFPGFVTATGLSRLGDLVRYLQAVEHRLDKLPRQPGRDRDRMRQVQRVRREYDDLAAELGDTDELGRIRWMLEELRVSYFAQQLRTAYPVSDKRIYRAMDELVA